MTRFVLRRPPPPLGDHVDAIWHFENDHFDHRYERILPSGDMQLLVNLSEDAMRWYAGPNFGTTQHLEGAGIQGAFDRPFAIDTDEQRAVLGVGFRCGGASAVLGIPSVELAADHVGLTAIWGDASRQFRERLLELTTPEARIEACAEMLAERLHRNLVDRSRSAPAPHLRTVRYVAAGLGDGLSVATLARDLGWSEGRMRRRFNHVVGLTPKRFARVCRFQHVLRQVKPYIGATPWTEIAHSAGYFDQAHLIRDFRALSGLRPTDYVARTPDARNHVVIDG